MKKTVFYLAGYFLSILPTFAQISELPYQHGFEEEFTTGTPVEFLTDWTGNDVAATNRIYKDNVVFRNGLSALSIIPTGSFDGDIKVSLDLTSYENVAMKFYAKSMQNGTGNRPTILTMSTSIDGGDSWTYTVTINSFPNADQAEFTEYIYTLPTTANNASNVIVRLEATGGSGSGTRAKLIIDDVEISQVQDETEDAPIINLTEGFSAFTQVSGYPTSVQSILVSASNISEIANITVTEPFQVSLSETETFSTSITLPLTEGNFDGNVYVRLNGTEANEAVTGTLTLSTEGADNVTRNLEGQIIASNVTQPEPFVLLNNTYSFTEWSEAEEAGTYPSNMMFWINEAGNGVDPTSESLFVRNWDCVYNISQASRIVGSNADGVSFINTGNMATLANCHGNDETGRLIGKPGAAVIALDTQNVENIEVKWTGRTIAQNNRIYAIGFQYRIGNGDGDANLGWQNLEETVEYLANVDGHSENFEITLPEDANNKELVQVRWIYFQHESNGETTGSRAQLAIDEILISGNSLSNEEFTTEDFNIYPNPSSDFIYFSKNSNVILYDLNGKQVLSSDNTNQINVSGLSKGVYVLKTDKGTTKKIVVK